MAASFRCLQRPLLQFYRLYSIPAQAAPGKFFLVRANTGRIDLAQIFGLNWQVPLNLQ
jgi:hypothetical protein